MTGRELLLIALSATFHDCGNSHRCYRVVEDVGKQVINAPNNAGMRAAEATTFAGSFLATRARSRHIRNTGCTASQ